MQVKIGIRFHRAEITYFEINRLYAYVKQIQQADYMRRNSLLIKVQVKNKTIYQKLANSIGNTFSFIPHVYNFSYLPSLTTLFSTKMMGQETQSQEH